MEILSRFIGNRYAIPSVRFMLFVSGRLVDVAADLYSR